MTKQGGGLLLPPEGEPLPTTPTAEAWRAMTPEARLDFLVAVNEVLSASASLMGEGRPHKNAKLRTIDALGLHFKTIGRTVYLAEELAVLYPGEKPFTPDVLAVLDVPPPEDDQRMAWVVADEGKGPDLVLEVLYHGDRRKDLVGNVELYARLGIREYFVYDGLRQQIHGHRLAGSSYQRIVPQLGRYRSDVLDLNLAIIKNNLRVLSGEATLPGSAGLIGRLQDMMESLEAKAEEAQAQIDEARATEAQGLREVIAALLQARGIPLTEEARARVAGCAEAAVLREWMLRATTASGAEEVFSAGGPGMDLARATR